MNNVMAIHRKAMEWADEGQSLLDRGERSDARTAFRKAMELEREAACAPNVVEPDRSILFRSAGSLALECDEIRAAEQLLAMGLAGNPPEEIAEEIRDLLEQTHFRRHLETRGIVLEPNEVQMSIAGSAVGYGIASSNEFLVRVQNFEKLVLRTDGERVSLVGITSRRPDRSRKIALTKTRQELAKQAPEPDHTDKEPADAVEVRGTLQFADMTGGKADVIKLVEGGNTYQIDVPKGRMAELVRPLWNRVVLVSGRRRGTRIELEDIKQADSP